MLHTLEGKTRNQLYKTYDIQLLILNKRIDFTGKGANYFNTSYFLLEGFTETNNVCRNRKFTKGEEK